MIPFYRKVLLELLQFEDYGDDVQIIYRTDNSCLYDKVHSSTQILDNSNGYFERNDRK